jgi:hypothetical protein
MLQSITNMHAPQSCVHTFTLLSILGIYCGMLMSTGHELWWVQVTPNDQHATYDNWLLDHLAWCCCWRMSF